MLMVGCTQAPSEANVETALAETQSAQSISTSIGRTQTAHANQTQNAAREATSNAISTEIASRPTKTRTPTRTSTSIPEPLHYEGSGDDIVELDSSVASWQPALIHMEYGGSGNFIVWGYDAQGEHTDLLANIIGNYSGTRLLNISDNEITTRLSVEANSSWTIDIFPFHFNYLTVVNVPGTYEGSGDTVLVLSGNPDTISANATGRSNFVLWAWTSDDRDLIFNEIAPYSGRAILPIDTILLEILAESLFTLEITSR